MVRADRLTLVLILLATLSAGCVSFGADDAPRGHAPPGSRNAFGEPVAEPYAGPNVTLAGRVVDHATGAPLANATVTVHFTTGDPCGTGVRLRWRSWTMPVDDAGAFESDAFAAPGAVGSFDVRVEAPGYAVSDASSLWDPAESRVLPPRTLALTPATRVVLATAPGDLIAWWPVGAPHVFEAARADANETVVVAPAGPLVGLVQSPDGAVRSWVAEGRAFAEAGAAAEPPAPPPNATARVAVARAGAVVVAATASGAPVALAVAGADGAATLPIASGTRAIAHAWLPGTTLRGAGAIPGTGQPIALAHPGCRPG